MDSVTKIENEIKASALDLIGNTPLVALDRLWPGPGRILAKCEFMNPCGSIKCRSSLHMLQKARESGELKTGAPVSEVTSGNQGCGLAVVCAVLGHPLTVAMSQGNSIERAIHMEALGATCLRVPQVEGSYGSVTLADVLEAEKTALRVAEETNGFYVNQINSKTNFDAHYCTTGPEIWRQTGQRIDAFISTVGTGGSFIGTSKFLKEINPNIKCFVAEPQGSEPIKGCPITKPLHLLQGSGYGFVPTSFNFDHLDGTFSITDDEAVKYKKLIGEKEGLYVGYTSGANIAAAIKLLQSGQLSEDAWVVTLLNDTGLKYSPIPEKLTLK